MHEYLIAVVIVLLILLFVRRCRENYTSNGVAFMGQSDRPMSVVDATTRIKEGLTLDQLRFREGMTLDQLHAPMAEEHLAPHPLQRNVPNPLKHMSQLHVDLNPPRTVGAMSGMPYEGYTNPHSENKLPSGYTTGTSLTIDDIASVRTNKPYSQLTYGGIFSQNPKERAKQYQKAFKGPLESAPEVSPLVENYYPDGYDSIYLIQKQRAERAN